MFRIIPEGLAYREHVLLKDGLGVLLRPATPEDVPLVEAFMRRLSPESLRLRFMAAVKEVPRSVVEQLCGGDFTDRGCLLAIVGDEEEPRVVGLGNYVGLGDGRRAEVAFLVADAYQGRGISTLLLERLAGLAAANGYVELEAEVLPENRAMLGVFKSSGFEIHQVWSSDTVHIELPVGGGAALHERAELRERIAVANSLVPLLRPRTVAVAGASRDPRAIGNLIFRHILGAGFAGTVHPINPQADSVAGVQAYASLADLPHPPDLVVIAVPAEKVLEVAEAAVEAGARALVVVTAGFAESGEEGARRQRRLVELVRAHGARLLGPSCLGLMNTDPEVRLNASLAPRLAPPGPVGFFSHSAALGLVVLETAAERGLGFSSFVSAGNRADVSGNDLLQFWEEDPRTRIAVLYLEPFGNPRRFARIARRMTQRMPILCVKGARSRAGRRTAERRSGLPGAGEVETDALFQQTGVIRAETLEELFDVALVLAHQPLPAGRRVAVVANSAGVATIFADACEGAGLELAGPGLVNLGALADAAAYEGAVRGALADDAVDALFVAFAQVGECPLEEVAAAIRRGVRAAESATGRVKPVLLCLMGTSGAVPLVEEDATGDDGRMFPAFRFPEAAAKALGRVARYAEHRRRPPGQLVWYEDVDGAGARRQAKEALAGGDGRPVVLEGEAARELLARFGIGVRAGEPSLTVRVEPDPLFGPLLKVAAAGGEPVVRITPLTDRDVIETMERLGLATGSAAGELLGRISQMVEELPWLAELDGAAPAAHRPAVLPGVRVVLRPVGG